MGIIYYATPGSWGDGLTLNEPKSCLKAMVELVEKLLKEESKQVWDGKVVCAYNSRVEYALHRLDAFYKDEAGLVDFYDSIDCDRHSDTFWSVCDRFAPPGHFFGITDNGQIGFWELIESGEDSVAESEKPEEDVDGDILGEALYDDELTEEDELRLQGIEP